MLGAFDWFKHMETWAVGVADQVKDATEAVQQLPRLVEAIVAVSQSPLVMLIVAFIFALWVFAKKDFSYIFGFIERKRSKRLGHLNDYVERPELADSEAMQVLRDLRDAHYFKVATGIYAEKGFRKSLIKLHQDTSHLIGWPTIRSALAFIEIGSDGEAKVREPFLRENIERWYNNFTSGFFFVVGVFWLIFYWWVEKRTMEGVAIGFAAFVLFVGGAFIFRFQNFPYLASRKIKKELEGREINKAGNPSKSAGKQKYVLVKSHKAIWMPGRWQ
ncbi:hypothetical protein [Chitiniphilus shinanonensis]|uniref:hypothetical protein n=1 Tax=Chitiniphilus shinanonensis TaxID=553088 RepID=UPI0030606683